MRHALNQRKCPTQKRAPSEARRYPPHSSNGAQLRETFEAAAKVLEDLPLADNTEGAVEKMLRANAILRHLPWPKPFDETTHRFRGGDARDLSWLPNESVQLVVTSPPYWTLKEYEPHTCQLGAIANYEAFLCELDKVWVECARVLAPGGRICCVVGDVCIPRKKEGRHSETKS
jgi:modification methylase